MEAASPALSATEMNELVLPTYANALGTIFGGQIMAWIDICAAMCAWRHARTAVVTASMDALDFHAPVHVGHLVNLQAMVNFVGRTSMEVGVRVESENPTTGERAHTASAYLTFVALDTAGRPQPCRPLLLETPAQTLRHAEAEARRAQRLQLAKTRAQLQTEARDGGSEEHH